MPKRIDHSTPGGSSPGGSKSSSVRPPRASVDGERLIAVLSELVEPLGRSLPATSEVVLHDLGRLPNSIIAVHGNVTGRRVGDPAPDRLLDLVADNDPARQIDDESRLPDGRRIRSSTMIVRDLSGYPTAALCINTDLSAWTEIRRIADRMIGSRIAAAPSVYDESESAWDFTPPPAAAEPAGPLLGPFPRDVDGLAAHLIHEAIHDVGIDALAMKKEHKIQVIETLQSKGFFMLKDAIEMIATRFHVTRFTIYNYLKEIADAQARRLPGPGDSAEQEDTPP